MSDKANQRPIVGFVIQCDRCGDELNEPGALMFAPPDPESTETTIVAKYHFCVSCFSSFFGPDGNWK